MTIIVPKTIAELKKMKVNELKSFAVSLGLTVDGLTKPLLVDTIVAFQYSMDIIGGGSDDFPKELVDELEPEGEKEEGQSEPVVEKEEGQSDDQSEIGMLTQESYVSYNGEEIYDKGDENSMSSAPTNPLDNVKSENDNIDLSNTPVTLIPINELTPSEMNFFKKLSDSKFYELVESIKANGLMMPIIVRNNVKGKSSEATYEILAGENRYRAFLELGKTEIPAKIITNISEDKAKEILVDTNVAQRDELSPMEIARAYDEKRIILGNRQGKRSDLNDEMEAGKTRDIIGQQYGKSGMTVDRYLRLVKLVPAFQEAIESEQMPTKVGMELGTISVENQVVLLEAIEAEGGDEFKYNTKFASRVKSKIKEIAVKENGGNTKGIKLDEVQLTYDDAVSILFEEEKTTNSTETAKMEISFDLSDPDQLEAFEWYTDRIENEGQEVLAKLLVDFFKGKGK